MISCTGLHFISLQDVCPHLWLFSLLLHFLTGEQNHSYLPIMYNYLGENSGESENQTLIYEWYLTYTWQFAMEIAFSKLCVALYILFLFITLRTRHGLPTLVSGLSITHSIYLTQKVSARALLAWNAQLEKLPTQLCHHHGCAQSRRKSNPQTRDLTRNDSGPMISVIEKLFCQLFFQKASATEWFEKYY